MEGRKHEGIRGYLAGAGGGRGHRKVQLGGLTMGFPSLAALPGQDHAHWCYFSLQTHPPPFCSSSFLQLLFLLPSFQRDSQDPQRHHVVSRHEDWGQRHGLVTLRLLLCFDLGSAPAKILAGGQIDTVTLSGPQYPSLHNGWISASISPSFHWFWGEGRKTQVLVSMLLTSCGARRTHLSPQTPVFHL